MHPDNVQQILPVLELMATKEYTPKEWLNFYKNLWTRNLVARTIDVQSDTLLKAQNAEEIVMTDDGRQVKVGERLELRKIYVRDALSLIKAIDALNEKTAEEFVEACWSDKALAVAEDMIPKKEEEVGEVGQSCSVDGKPGIWMKQGDKMVCVPATEPAAAPVEPGTAEEEKRNEGETPAASAV